MNATNEKLGNIAVPDVLIKKIKARAAKRGVSIRKFVTPALEALAAGKNEMTEVTR